MIKPVVPVIIEGLTLVDRDRPTFEDVHYKNCTFSKTAIVFKVLRNVVFEQCTFDGGLLIANKEQNVTFESCVFRGVVTMAFQNFVNIRMTKCIMTNSFMCPETKIFALLNQSELNDCKVAPWAESLVRASFPQP